MHWFRKRIELVRTPAMSEAEINTALRVADTNTLWRAVIQLLDESREEAIREQLHNSPLALAANDLVP